MTWGEDTIPSVVMTAICGRGLRKGPVAWKHPQAREFSWALLPPHRSGAALTPYGQELQPMFLDLSHVNSWSFFRVVFPNVLMIPSKAVSLMVTCLRYSSRDLMDQLMTQLRFFRGACWCRPLHRKFTIQNEVVDCYSGVYNPIPLTLECSTMLFPSCQKLPFTVAL